MSMIKKLLAIPLLVFSIHSFAQKDSTFSRQLDEVVVTASKTLLKQSQTGKIVTVLDQKIISNNAGRSLSELLNTQAGFFINGANNTPGTNLDVYFRGAGTGNMLIVIDGIPVFDPSQSNNSFDLNSIPLDQVERIEILKGGQSTTWGSDAVAGVIQVFLKKNAKKKLLINGSLAAGTYNTTNAGAGISGTVNRLGYSVQYNHAKSDGLSAAYDSTGTKNFDKDGFEQNNWQAELNYQFSNSVSARAFGNFSNYHNGLDAGAFTDDRDFTAKNKNNLGGLFLQYRKTNFTWHVSGSYQQAKRSFTDDSTDISTPYSNFSQGNYTGNTITAETYGNARISRHLEMVGGVQYIHQNTKQSYLSISSFGPFETALGKDSSKINQWSAYASLLVLDVNGFSFEAGGRVNNHSIYGNNATFTINPSFKIDENTRFFLNVSSAYKIPSIYQLYSEYGNKDLKPESSITYEAGIQAEDVNKKFMVRFVGFKRDTKNLIIFFTDPVTFAGKYINRDKQNDYGFELESTLQLADWGNWNNNFAFIDGQGTEDHIKIDNLYRRPKFTMNSTLTLQPVKSLTIIPAFRYVGSRLSGPYDAGPAEQPHYYILNCFVGYKVINNLRVFINLHNITNQQYFDVPGYNSKRFNFMAGINIQF